MRIGFTCSTFDLFHAGHALMLKEAKEVCDYLIVGLQTDPTLDKATTNEQDDLPYKSDRSHKQKPIMSLEERRILLENSKHVDFIIEYDTEVDLYNLLKILKIDIRIIGSDYKGKGFTGKDLVEDGIHEIYYNSRNHDYSTTNLRERIKKL